MADLADDIAGPRRLFRCTDRAGKNLGRLRVEEGKPDEGLGMLERSADLYRGLGDARGEASALEQAARSLTASADIPSAREHLSRSLLLRRRIRDDAGEAESLDALGLLHSRAGDWKEAMQALDQSLEMYRRLGDRSGQATVQSHLAAVHFSRGRFAEALRLEEGALSLRRSLRDLRGEALSLNNLAAIHQSLGDNDAALRRARETQIGIGELLIRQRDPEGGRRHCESALHLSQANGLLDALVAASFPRRAGAQSPAASGGAEIRGGRSGTGAGLPGTLP